MSTTHSPMAFVVSPVSSGSSPRRTLLAFRSTALGRPISSRIALLSSRRAASLPIHRSSPNDYNFQIYAQQNEQEQEPKQEESQQESNDISSETPAVVPDAAVAETTTSSTSEQAEITNSSSTTEIETQTEKITEPESESESESEPEPEPSISATAAASEEEEDKKMSGGGDRRRRRRTRGKREVTLPLEDLKRGMELEGTVRGVMQYGAFIGNLGTPTDGLLHVSELSAGFVENVSDVVNVGDKVTVRVLSVDMEKKTFSLTMKTAEQISSLQQQSDNNTNASNNNNGSAALSRKEEQKKKWATFSFDPEVFIDAKVLSITDFGAFCQLIDENGAQLASAPTDGLLHISEVSKGRVEKVSDVLSDGDIIKVRVIATDPARNRMSLSLKEVPDESEVQEKSSDRGGYSGSKNSVPLDENESGNYKEDLAAAEANQPSFKSSFEIAFEKANFTLSNN